MPNGFGRIRLFELRFTVQIDFNRKSPVSKPTPSNANVAGSGVGVGPWVLPNIIRDRCNLRSAVGDTATAVAHHSGRGINRLCCEEA